MLAQMVALAWVVLVDFALSFDNAAVITLTAESVPEEHRTRVRYTGIALAVVFRILLSLIAAVFMQHAIFTVVGGLYLVYVCYKMVVDRNADEQEVAGWSVTSLLGPVTRIIIADLAMSMDNVIAVSAVARSHPGMIVFGMVLSVSLMALATEFLSWSLKKWPSTYYYAVGAVALTAAKMLTEGLFAKV